VEGIVAAQEIWIGSRNWLESRGVSIPEGGTGSAVHWVVNRQWRGAAVLNSALRAEVGDLIGGLSAEYDLALLSGDNDSQRATFAAMFGDRVHFQQTPINKLEYIAKLQDGGAKVLMAGDGLNDAGALKQSNVGVAVAENVGGFSPASDVIMDALMLSKLGRILSFSRDAVQVVRWSFGLSAIYNAVGIAIAARGLLEPWVCAILMPISSVTVVGVACAATGWMARRRAL
jgi:Cu+-exporting ATPase